VRSLLQRRLQTVAWCGAVWVALIAGRFYQLQVMRHEHYAGKAERQQQRVVALDPPRGTIYDSRGRELAVSVQVDSAYAVPPQVPDAKATAAAIARVLPGVDGSRLARQLGQDREFVWVARKIDPPIAAALRALDLPGIYFARESKRYYPMRELAAQVLGYVGTDNHGLAGLELLYDKVVSGKPGVRTVLRDARHGTLVSPELSSAEPEPGQDLYLTLDVAVQHIVERELAQAVEERGANRGSAVFLDPATGGVLAMASYPSFDPNKFSEAPPSRWRNRAIADVYEPGSTFKIVTAAAALGSGKVRPEDVFDCEMGGITLLGILIRDHKPYGRLTFADVIAKSSNVGVIKAALLVGDQGMYQTIESFGFGRPTGIDLPGESAGILHPLERWGPLAKAYIAFGQGISVTPLQLATAVTAVANDGNLLRPHVVEAMGRGTVRHPRFPAPPVVRHPITPETAGVLKGLLEGVVISGTGRGAAVAGYRVAGKTGTAQIPVAGGYSHSSYIPSFVGFAPADRPQLVGIVAIDGPRGEYYGGQVAAPVFATVTRQVLLYLGVRPRRAPLALWPGQHGGPMVASLSTPARAEPAGIFPDGEDPPQPSAPSLLYGTRGPETHGAPGSAPSSPAGAAGAVGGGRSHAPV
jgi:cell division protein FtsI (penicillin-binding protein 3)